MLEKDEKRIYNDDEDDDLIEEFGDTLTDYL